MLKIKILNATLIFVSLCQSSWGLSLGEVFEKVVETNPVLLSTRQNVEIAEENVKQERADFLPLITASGGIYKTKQDIQHGTTSGGIYKTKQDIQHGTNTTLKPKQARVDLSQTLFAGGSEVFTYKSSKYLLNQAKFSYDASLQNILNNTVNAYVSVLTAQGVYKLQENQIKLLTEQLKLTNARFEQGELTRTDVKQAEARLALSQASKIQAKGLYRTARTALNNLVGENVLDLQWPHALFELPTAYSEELMNNVLLVHPDAVAARAIYDSQRYLVKASRSAHAPTLSAVASFSDNRDTTIGDYDYKTLGLVLSVPLFTGGRIFSQVRELIASREQAKQNYDQVKRDLNQDLVNAIELYHTATASLEAFKESESAAVIAEKGVANEQRLGERTVLDLLDARQELLEARLNVTIAKGDVVIRAFSLLKALGELDVSDAKGKVL